jgi:hypothetical protein
MKTMSPEKDKITIDTKELDLIVNVLSKALTASIKDTFKILPTTALWSVEDCARYFGVDKTTFNKNIASNPKFPKPYVNLTPPGGVYDKPRWRSSDIKSFRG